MAGFSGSSKSYWRYLSRRTAIRSAADIDDVGWPEPAAAAARTESTRSCCPSSCQRSLSVMAAILPRSPPALQRRRARATIGAWPWSSPPTCARSSPGPVLFDGVSFKLERRDRLALAGPNGAGKTTLLRMLIGETSIEGGELVVEKGTRIALHDQRPPLDRD